MESLIIDQNKKRAKLFEANLSKLKLFDRHQASSITEAETYFKNNEISIIFMSIDESEGFKNLELVKTHNNPNTKRIPVICYSESIENIQSPRAIQLGASNVVSIYMPREMIESMVKTATNPMQLIAGLKALVVDDSALSRKLISSVLRNHGIESVETKDGQEAINIMKERGREFEIVFLDENMPYMSGREVAKYIQNQLGFKDITIIFVASHNDQVTAEDYYDAGAADYIIKPVPRKELIQKVYLHARSRVVNFQLGSALHNVSKVEKERRELVNMCLYDILTPLATIKGLAEIIAEGECQSLDEAVEDSKKIIEAVKNIMNATDRMIIK